VTEPRPVAEGRTAARDVRTEHKLATTPIVDLFGFIETNYSTDTSQTLVIRKQMPQGPEGALIRSGADLLLIVNTSGRLLARQRFTAAHELGHHHFDSGANTAFVERDLFVNDAKEMRANAFAVNLLLPLEAVKERIATGQLNTNDDTQLVALSLEFGLSMQSLGYHLKNNNIIGQARRQELSTLQPLKLASALGDYDRVRQEFEARDVTRWPTRFVQLAGSAREAGNLSGLAQALLEQDEFATEFLEMAKDIDLFSEVDPH
jgi:Zn-dependent peptidase ImmA (M78 family)